MIPTKGIRNEKMSATTPAFSVFFFSHNKLDFNVIDLFEFYGFKQLDYIIRRVICIIARG